MAKLKNKEGAYSLSKTMVWAVIFIFIAFFLLSINLAIIEYQKPDESAVDNTVVNMRTINTSSKGEPVKSVDISKNAKIINQLAK
ncbi:MAG: hypothetical protein Q7R78_00355 [bacterium]|nr:hypothetical protein [bacterium]